MLKFVYRKSDNVFIGGDSGREPPMITGPDDPIVGLPTQVPDFVNYGVAKYADADLPDLKLHRYAVDVSGPEPKDGKRLATAQELAAVEDAETTQKAELTSRQKDTLTTIAYIVRRSNVAAWNAMTPAEKRTAVMQQADIWRDLRVVMEKL